MHQNGKHLNVSIQYHYSFLAVIPCLEMFNSMAMTERSHKNLCNIMCWTYFLVRTYHQYGKNQANSSLGFSSRSHLIRTDKFNSNLGYVGFDLTAGAIFLVFCGDQIARAADFYFLTIKGLYENKQKVVSTRLTKHALSLT